jgi:TonB family protein
MTAMKTDNKRLVSLALALSFATLQVPAFAQLSGEAANKWDSDLNVGRDLREAQKYDQAEKQFLDLQAQAESVKDVKRARKALTAIAAVYFDRKNYAKAEELDRKALGIAESVAVDNDGTVAVCLNDLAEVLVEQKRYDEALPLMKRCVALSEKTFSHNHPVLGVRLSFLADLLDKMGRKDEAIQYRSEGQGIINAFLSVMSRKIKAAWKPPRCLYGYSANVGFEVTDHGVLKEAHIIDSSGNAANDEAALAAVRDAQPYLDITSSADDDQAVLTFKFDYSYHQRKDADAATQAAETIATSNVVVTDAGAKIESEKKNVTETLKAIEKIKKEKGHSNTTLAELYGKLSDSLMVLGEQERAINYLKDALNTSDFSDKNSPGTLMMLSELGCVYLGSMRLSLAQSTLKEVVDSPNFEQIIDVKLKLQALDDLGHALSTMGRHAEAQKYYSRMKERTE